jgi:hypothetical protein
MPRKKKQEIKTNDTDSLEGLLQETYNDACSNISEAQRNINILENSSKPEDIDDLTKIAKEKNGALKVKDSAIRIKMEIAKLQSDIIKNRGANQDAQKSSSGVDLSDFKEVRRMIMDSAKQNQKLEDIDE